MKGGGKGDGSSVLFQEKEEEGGRGRYFSCACEDEVKSGGERVSSEGVAFDLVMEGSLLLEGAEGRRAGHTRSREMK